MHLRLRPLALCRLPCCSMSARSPLFCLCQRVHLPRCVCEHRWKRYVRQTAQCQPQACGLHQPARRFCSLPCFTDPHPVAAATAAFCPVSELALASSRGAPCPRLFCPCRAALVLKALGTVPQAGGVWCPSKQYCMLQHCALAYVWQHPPVQINGYPFVSACFSR